LPALFVKIGEDEWNTWKSLLSMCKSKAERWIRRRYDQVDLLTAQFSPQGFCTALLVLWVFESRRLQILHIEIRRPRKASIQCRFKRIDGIEDVALGEAVEE
jgi:hypothetical protein